MNIQPNELGEMNPPFYLTASSDSRQAGFSRTFAARRLTASSLRRCTSGVPGQLPVLSVLLVLDGGVGCGGWLRGSSALAPPAPGKPKQMAGIFFFKKNEQMKTYWSICLKISGVEVSFNS